MKTKLFDSSFGGIICCESKGLGVICCTDFAIKFFNALIEVRGRNGKMAKWNKSKVFHMFNTTPTKK